MGKQSRHSHDARVKMIQDHSGEIMNYNFCKALAKLKCVQRLICKYKGTTNGNFIVKHLFTTRLWQQDITQRGLGAGQCVNGHSNTTECEQSNFQTDALFIVDIITFCQECR